MSFHLRPNDFDHRESSAVALLALGVGHKGGAKKSDGVVWGNHFFLGVFKDSLDTVNETGGTTGSVLCA